MEFMDTEVFGVALVPLILALVELFKRTGFPDKWSPVLSVVLGLAGGLLLYSDDPIKAAVVGLALGLSATGLFSGSKNVKEGVEEL